MPQYLAPGVYVEEISAPAPIVGVSTSTAAFIGIVDAVTMPIDPAAPGGSVLQRAETRTQRVLALAQRVTREVAAALDAVANRAAPAVGQAKAGEPATVAAANSAVEVAARAVASAADVAADAVAAAQAAVASARDADVAAPGPTGDGAPSGLVTETHDTLKAAQTLLQALADAGTALGGAPTTLPSPTSTGPTSTGTSGGRRRATADGQPAKLLEDAQKALTPHAPSTEGSSTEGSSTEAPPELEAAAEKAATTAAGLAEAQARRARPTAGVPVFVAGWTDFVEHFGDVQPGNRVLAHAVRGFFANGGSRCFVIPLDAPAGDDKTVTGAGAGVDAALATLVEKAEGVSLVAVPGAQGDVRNAVVDHCGSDERRDRFAVLDGPEELPKTDSTQTMRDSTHDSSYGALYLPWLTVPGETDPVPPSGHVAGIMARVDQDRGVFKAPANEVVLGVSGVDGIVGQAQQTRFNPVGVNVIRSFEGTVRVWGARTLAREQPEYVSVRRSLIFLRESILQNTQWVTFEPNGPDLWAKIRRSVTAFLTTQWAAGMLLGDTAAQAFSVRCDAATNRKELTDLGQVTTEIGVAVVRPAEFVVFRIGQSVAATGAAP